MSNDQLNQLIGLYTVIKDGGEQIQEATELIQNLYTNPESILLHSQMFEQCENHTLKLHALIGIKEMVMRNRNNISFEICQQLGQWLIICSQVVVDDHLYRSALDIIEEILAKFPSQFNEQFYQLAIQLLGQPETKAKGLYFWKRIFPKRKDEDITTDRSFSLLKELFVVCSESLVNEDPFISQAAFALIDRLMWEIPSDYAEKDETVIPIFEQAEISLTQYATTIFKTETITPQLKAFIASFTEVFSSERPFFSDHSIPILDVCLMAISDETIPVHVRIFIHSLLYEALTVPIKPTQPTEVVLNATIQLTIQACQEKPLDDAYTFSEDYFNHIIHQENLLPFFIEAIAHFSQIENVAAREVALLLINSSIAAMNLEQAKYYLFHAITISDIENETLIQACCSTLSQFIEKMPELIIHIFPEMAAFLTKHIFIEQSVPVLSEAIKNAHQPPQYFKSLIEYLVSLIPQCNGYQTINILYCLDTCFSLSFLITDLSLIEEYTEFFAEISNMIFSIIKMHENFVGIGLQCISHLIPIHPIFLHQNISSILQFCLEMMASPLDHNFSSAANCIRQFVAYFPNTIIPQISEIISRMLEIITMPMPNIPEMEIESNIYCFKASKVDCIQCLCVIAQENQQFADEFGTVLWSSLLSFGPSDLPEEITKNFQGYVHDQNGEHLIRSSNPLISGIKLFSRMRPTLSSVLLQILSDLQKETDFQAILMGLKVIENMIRYLPRDIIQDVHFQDKINQIIVPASTGLLDGFLNQVWTVPAECHRALLRTMIAFADICRDKLLVHFEHYIQSFQYILSETNKLVCAHILHFLSKIILYGNFKGDFSKTVIDIIFAVINGFPDNNFIDYEILTHIFVSLICLFRSDKEQFRSYSSEVITYLHYFILTNPTVYPEFRRSYQTLYLYLAFLYEMPMNQLQIRSILDNVQVMANSEFIPFLADIYVSAYKLFGNSLASTLARFSIVLFSSDQYMITLIDQEIIAFYFEFIKTISPDDLLKMCNFNESLFNQILLNIGFRSS